MIDLTTTTRQYLTIEEFAASIGRARRTVYYWIASSKVLAVYTPFGQRIAIHEARRIAGYLDGCLQLRARPVAAHAATSTQARANSA